MSVTVSGTLWKEINGVATRQPNVVVDVTLTLWKYDQIVGPFSGQATTATDGTYTCVVSCPAGDSAQVVVHPQNTWNSLTNNNGYGSCSPPGDMSCTINPVEY